MKISLIDNGLDSLAKGYEFLKRYEELKDAGGSDSARFSVLKDAILSIQHGIEILLKYLIKEKNEILLFSEISPKLRLAFKRRKDGEIAELYEEEGIHTVSFRESIERINDVLGIEVSDRLRKILLKIEKWRNGIIHSGVLLNENEVSGVLFDAMDRLDEFFGPAIGEQYKTGQGRQELDRAYKIFKVTHGNHKNVVKEGVVQRLIEALSNNGIKRVTSPGVFVTKDAEKAFSVLKSMQGDDARYGCDMINLHCSGKAFVTELKQSEMTITTEDNNADYRFSFSGLLVFVPKIEDDLSPLVFLYSSGMIPMGRNGRINEYKGFSTQEGILLTESDQEIWDNDEIIDFYHTNDDDYSSMPRHKGIYRFVSPGMVCFMNVQLLSHGKAKDFLYSRRFDKIDDFEAQLTEYIKTL